MISDEIQQVIDTIYKQFSKYGFIQQSPGKQDLPIQDGFLQIFISPLGRYMDFINFSLSKKLVLFHFEVCNVLIKDL